jgi:hypothetical protein
MKPWRRLGKLSGLFLILLHFNASADPLGQWVERNPLPADFAPQGVFYANGLFIVFSSGAGVGGGYRTVTSPDG